MGDSRSVLRSLVALGALVFGVGCPGEKGSATPEPVDADGDGYGVDEDCDDGDAGVHPGVDEVWYDGVDQNCDGLSDYDADGDGTYVDGIGADDCDDFDPEVYENETDIMALGIGPDCADMLVSARRYGEQAEDGASAGSAAGDVNGDGYDDILMRAWGWKDDTGATVGANYVVLGPMTGDQSLATADARILGTEEWIGFGALLEGLGDVDGDGYDDIIASRPVGDWDVMSVVFMGPISGDLSIEDGDGTWSQNPSTEVGYAVGVGDVDGDELPDIGYRVDSDAYGRSGAGLARGPLAGDHTLAEEVAFVSSPYSGDYCAPRGVGDINGDGFADVGVVCRGSAVALFSGPISGDYILSEGDATFAVAHSYVCGAGDTNGDGYADLTLSSSQAAAGSDEFRGAVFQYWGPVLGAKDPYTNADVMLVGENSGDFAVVIGEGVDLNGDGLDDTLVGAFLDTNLGAIYALLSPTSGTVSLGDAWWKVTGDTPDNQVSLLGTLGDTDGDGYADVLLGQLTQSVMQPEDGAFYLLRGGT